MQENLSPPNMIPFSKSLKILVSLTTARRRGFLCINSHYCRFFVTRTILLIQLGYISAVHVRTRVTSLGQGPASIKAVIADKYAPKSLLVLLLLLPLLQTHEYIPDKHGIELNMWGNVSSAMNLLHIRYLIS